MLNTNIDLRALWIYRPVFTSWFVPSLLLANFIYVRRTTSLSYLNVLGADVAMTGLSWMLIAGVPDVPFVTWGLVLVISGRASAVPIVGMIPVLVISGLISTIFQSALLRCFKHKVTRIEFWLL